MMTPLSLSSARFYAILDTGYVEDARWESTCSALIHGGADIIQLRAKDKNAFERKALLARILPLFTEVNIPLIINDDLELALSQPRLGLHIGQDDISVQEARTALGPQRILGLSTHSPQQVEQAIALHTKLNYFAVGPVFATPTKPTYQPVGLQLVQHVAALQPPLPWFCIGGIKLDNIDQVIAAGGQRAVAVSEILKADQPKDIIQAYQAKLRP